MPDMADGTPPEAVEADIEQQPDEPVGAQVLRRVHQDSSALLEEYDSWLSVLEHEGVKTHLTAQLERLEECLTETEELFNSEYSELQGLDGAMEEEAPAETPAEAPDETPDGKDMDEPDDTNAVPADSGTPPDDSDDESGEKALRNGKKKHLKKSADPAKVPGYEENQKKPGARGSEANFKAADPEAIPGSEEHQDKPGETGTEDDLAASVKFLPHHHKTIGEAKSHLKDLSEKPEMDDEDKMKCYHFHKGLGDIVSAITGIGGSKSVDPATVPGYEEHQKKPGSEGSEANFKSSDPPTTPGSEEHQDKPGHSGSEGDFKELPEIDDEHPHVKALREASGFFGDMARTTDFGDEHRQKCLMHHKALDPIAQADNTANVQDNVGDMDTKAARLYEAAKALNEKLVRFNSVIAR